MRNVTNVLLLVSMFSLTSACGSSTFVADSDTTAPANQKTSQDAKELDTDGKGKDFANDTEDTQSLLEQETDACNRSGGILMNDGCQVCPVGQVVDAGNQSCVLANNQDSAAPDTSTIGSNGDSVDVKGLINVFGELLKNLPKDDGGGGGGGGCP